jgi:5-methylcytosine-specific restriction endonuclease McrA
MGSERQVVNGSVESSPALVLNADFRPLSYFPLSLWPWQDAVKAVFLNRVTIVSEYDLTVRSPNFEMQLPSVIALKEYVSQARKPAFTRFNVFLRDRFCCQYCGEKFPTPELTFDHVVPRSRGGRTSWLNVVTACGVCNLRKGNKMPDRAGLFPLNEPVEPTTFLLQEHGRGFPPNFLHESWRDYLYWDSALEDDG